MRSLIYFTRELPGISEDLTERSIQVYEALALSEVFYLSEQYPDSIVLIDHSVDDAAAQEVASRLVTLRLKPHATVTDVFWELSLLSASPAENSVQ